MVRRHSSSADFQLVGQSQDPTPGDVEEIRRIEVIYREVADGAAGALTQLQRGGAVSRGRGAAMDALREQIDDDLPGKLRKARDSYQEAADAYATYLPSLQEAQDTLDRAVDEARAGQAQVSGNALQLAQNAVQDAVRAGTEPTDEAQGAVRDAQEQISAGQGQLRAARGLAAQARALRDRAAARCGDSLDRAADKALTIPRKKFFQRVADFFKNFPFVKILLGILIAIVTVFVPVVGLLLSAALFAFEQVTAIATGAFQLGDFLVGLVGFIPGGSLFSSGKSVVTGLLPDLASVLTKLSSLSSVTLTFNIALDFGKQAATAGLNALGSGTAFEFNAGAALAGAAAGGLVNSGLKFVEGPRLEPGPPGPPGRSDFSAFDRFDFDTRADEQFNNVASGVIGGQVNDLVTSLGEKGDSDGGIPIKGSTDGSAPA